MNIFISLFYPFANFHEGFSSKTPLSLTVSKSISISLKPKLCFSEAYKIFGNIQVSIPCSKQFPSPAFIRRPNLSDPKTKVFRINLEKEEKLFKTSLGKT